MKIDFMEVVNALKYYEINDTNYINRCYQCVQDANLKNDFNHKIGEIYHILYTEKSLKIDTLWKRQNMIEVFSEEYHPFITNVLVLIGYKLHDKNMRTKRYHNTEKKLYKKRVREALTNDIYIRKLEGIRISQMIWAAYFINTKLIEVGRLQYEKCKKHIKIHIPSGDKLEIETALESIKNSKKEIKKYFQLDSPKYCCDSWLLSNQINKIIDCNSNIAKFYSLFEVKDGPDATKDILNFVFQIEECKNYTNLKENTSLQKILKYQLLGNRELKIGLGKLKSI